MAGRLIDRILTALMGDNALPVDDDDYPNTNNF